MLALVSAPSKEIVFSVSLPIFCMQRLHLHNQLLPAPAGRTAVAPASQRLLPDRGLVGCTSKDWASSAASCRPRVASATFASYADVWFRLVRLPMRLS